MSKPYDSVYEDLAWREPNQAIKNIQKILETPLSEEDKAGYSFLLHCLKEVSLESSYPSLLNLFFVVIADRFEKSPNSVLQNASVDFKKVIVKKDTPLLLEYLAATMSLSFPDDIFDPIVSSMFITLIPYLKQISENNRPLHSLLCAAHAKQLALLKNNKSNVYVRYQMVSPQNKESKLLIDPDGFSTMGYSGRKDLKYFDLRGSSFNYTCFSGYTLGFTNLSNTIWRHCKVDRVQVGKGCDVSGASFDKSAENVKESCLAGACP